MQDMTDKSLILGALISGKVEIQGQFVYGSNSTFIAELYHEPLQFLVVYKPDRGERPLYDFARGTLSKREAAAFWVSESLNWDLVPPTVYREDGLPLGSGSLQQFIEHDPEQHFFTFSEQEKQRLRPAAVFDLLINNTDRKGGHIFFDEHDHLWLIDHGICFHAQDKLRTVIWDFIGENIPEKLMVDIKSFKEHLISRDKIFKGLKELLSSKEIDALIARANRLIDNPVFPHPSENQRPFPWPPI